MAHDAFLRALASVPRGETRSFRDLATLADRPGAARVAGRVVAACGLESDLPWHRIVASDGALAKEPARARVQWRRLVREGARPRAGESTRAWARRVGCQRVGHWRSRTFLAADDPRLEGWDTTRVEPLADEAAARARGFRPEGEEAGADVPRPSQLAAVRARGPWPRRSIEERLTRSLPAARCAELLDRGYVHLPRLLAQRECASILAEAARPDRFERTVDLALHGFGTAGAYHYWREPLPEPAQELRRHLYAHFAPLGRELVPGLPASLDGLWRRCRARAQRRPSTILLGYGTGAVNHPHTDVYGPVACPFQALVMLSRRGHDFTGGELLLFQEEQQIAIPVDRGDLVVFVSRERRGTADGSPRRVPVRHGMSRVERGQRFALGLVFHLAR